MRYRSIYTFLWSFIKPYRWHYAAMLSAPILGAFYDFANNYAIKLVIDAFSADGPVPYPVLIAPIALFVCAQIGLDFVWRAADIAEWRSEPYVRQAIILEVYDRVQHHPYWFFQNTPAGVISSKIKGIVDGYDHFWGAMHHEFTPNLANSIVLTAVLAVVNVQVFLCVALWGLCLFSIMYRLSKTLDRLACANANDRHRIFGLIADNVANILTIFSFASRKIELKRLNSVIEDSFTPSTMRVYKFNFISNVIAAFLYWSMLISLFLFMIHLRQTGKASNGDVVFVMGISTKMAWELWQMIQKMQDFMKEIGDFKSAFELLQTPIDVPTTLPRHPNDATETLAFTSPSIVFKGVHFSYEPSTPILKGLSLDIRAGEKIGIVGDSGAGKSTIISLLLRYFELNQGQILIDGHNIADYSVDYLRAHVAVIPQDISLFHRSILENIAYGECDVAEERVIAAARAANIHDFIMTLPQQYQTFVGERGLKLSGGQRQRIAIARAMLKRAPILVLDEATSSLDAETERLIQASIDTLLNDRTVTVLAIAHRLSTLKHMDRIIVLEHGQIIEEGTHSTLIAQDSLYKKRWEMQKI